jgi:hypothetical protein
MDARIYIKSLCMQMPRHGDSIIASDRPGSAAAARCRSTWSMRGCHMAM